VYTAAISGYKRLWLACRRIVYSTLVLKRPSRRKLFRPSRLVGSYVSPWGPLALTDTLINMEDTRGKESKHRRETPPRNGEKEKGGGKEGAAPQKEGTNGRASCA
jgi:hypothetical protein